MRKKFFCLAVRVSLSTLWNSPVRSKGERKPTHQYLSEISRTSGDSISAKSPTRDAPFFFFFFYSCALWVVVTGMLSVYHPQKPHPSPRGNSCRGEIEAKDKTHTSCSIKPLINNCNCNTHTHTVYWVVHPGVRIQPAVTNELSFIWHYLHLISWELVEIVAQCCLGSVHFYEFPKDLSPNSHLTKAWQPALLCLLVLTGPPEVTAQPVPSISLSPRMRFLAL